MNKSELVEAIAGETSLSKVDVEKALNAFVLVVSENVRQGNKVALSGLGTFERVERAARQGINPATSEKILIKARKSPKFKAAKAFKEYVA